jgi:hypothetical protein
VFGRAEADALLRGLVADAGTFDRVVREIVARNAAGVTLDELAEAFSKEGARFVVPGVNPNPIFLRLMLLKKLQTLGASYEGDDLRLAKFTLGAAASAR